MCVYIYIVYLDRWRWREKKEKLERDLLWEKQSELCMLDREREREKGIRFDDAERSFRIRVNIISARGRETPKKKVLDLVKQRSLLGNILGLSVWLDDLIQLGRTNKTNML